MSGAAPGPIGVVGGGAFGTALAVATARTGKRVVLWARDPAQAETMSRERENRLRLPGVRLDEAITPTSAIEALEGAQMLVIAVPAQALRGACEALASVVREPLSAIVCAKGIERKTKTFMSDVVRQVLPRAIPAILSGPSFAQDVAQGLPTAVVIAAEDAALASKLAGALSSRALRLYHTTDIRGVEIGGAAKNVVAIAAGIVEGRRLGDSARAALTARGFAELRRFAAAHGAKPETLMGLSGLGDLMLSTSTPKSRNFALGLALGRGEAPDIAAHGNLAEGAFTASVLCEMARLAGLSMPVSDCVAAILERKLSIEDAVDALMNRPVRSEE
ncbi:MAG: NAD(P)-dependent glycerol-3-phosphate dehydrogenase [Hyphomicrobiales bacterium]|nr:NAD(P)-dependent glycerol-3-phosphate dehydrogenase [Hyphomicrobiales bacterium]